jgi:hypothetical protein
MKLADLRKLSIRKNLKIRFRLSNGLECVVTEQGIAQVPGLNRTADFNIEAELASAAQFILEPAGGDPKHPVPPRSLGREELASLTAASPAGAASAHEDED